MLLVSKNVSHQLEDTSPLDKKFNIHKAAAISQQLLAPSVEQ